MSGQCNWFSRDERFIVILHSAAQLKIDISDDRVHLGGYVDWLFCGPQISDKRISRAVVVCSAQKKKNTRVQLKCGQYTGRLMTVQVHFYTFCTYTKNVFRDFAKGLLVKTSLHL